jgi:hypothetical protein
MVLGSRTLECKPDKEACMKKGTVLRPVVPRVNAVRPAEDSYGDQYPVTEETVTGFGLTHMSTVEDDALDRCYEESGGDQSCFLATCSHV